MDSAAAEMNCFTFSRCSMEQDKVSDLDDFQKTPRRWGEPFLVERYDLNKVQLQTAVAFVENFFTIWRSSLEDPSNDNKHLINIHIRTTRHSLRKTQRKKKTKHGGRWRATGME